MNYYYEVTRRAKQASSAWRGLVCYPGYEGNSRVTFRYQQKAL